ncbi:MAG: hypothetical protein WA813_15455, partial [Beijerinckiaceae bacterium]
RNETEHDQRGGRYELPHGKSFPFPVSQPRAASYVQTKGRTKRDEPGENKIGGNSSVNTTWPD